MIAASLTRLWYVVPRPLRALASGGAATAADTVALLILCWGAGLPAGVAAFLACLVGGVVNFTIARAWIFDGGGQPWLAQAVRYGAIVVGGGAAVSGLAVAALVAVGLPLLVAKAGAVMIALVTWTYPMSARVVFAPSRLRDPANARIADGPRDPDALLVVR